MAAMSRNTPQVAANGVITAPPKAMVGGNRKKQKRRAKQAAKAAQAAAPQPQSAELDFDEDPLGYADEDDYEYSDAENRQYESYHPADHHAPNGYDLPSPNAGNKKSKKKKKKAGGGDGAYVVGSDRLPDLPNAPAIDHKGSHGQQNIWNTTTQQERQNIKNFWLSLSEEERKSLLRIEKEAVLRKMKQQQKHSCSCTVCGRKRTAIEEELEVLYEGYYEELENYAHGDQPPLPGSDHMLPAPLAHQHKPHPLATPPPPALHSHHRPSQMREHLDEDEEDELDDEDDEAEYSQDEAYSEDEYSEEEVELPRPPVPDFLDFGQNLTVKDNLLTVADDLLKNDGRKFIEMMEQLAERRMQRETEAEFASNHPAHASNYHQNDGPYGNDESMGPDDEFDDDEASYDSQEEFDDDLDEEDDIVSFSELHRRYVPTEKQQSGLTEEQRMQEGRRMFQIFAARMFEHRVLTAYKEKVAAERQQKLLEELQDEEKLEAQREAKKKRDAEKKKDKKRQQQAAKAEERAKKEAEKAAEEARIKEAEEKKQEEQRRKKEEQRRKKEEEKRKLEEERQRKEADRLRRQQEEQQRREDAERKARESRTRKEEARKREKEEKEAKERSVKDRKVQEEKSRSAKAAKQDEPVGEATPQIVKRPSQPTMVAVPGVFNKQNPSVPAAPSPKLNIATPAVPKSQLSAAKPKQSSQQGSHASSPRQAQSQLSSAPSKSSSPGSLPSQSLPAMAPKTILQKTSATQQQPTPQMQAMSPIQPPPGMSQPSLPLQHTHQPFPPMPQQNTFPPMPPPNMFPHQQAPLPGIAGANARPAMFPQAMPNVNIPGRMPSYGAANVNGLHGPPSAGMLGSQGRGNGFFDSPGGVSPNAPPGFGIGPASTQISPIGMPLANTTPSSESMRTPLSGHARQPSGAESAFEDVYGRRTTRPAPIQRPSSVKQHNDGIDDLSRHLGSSALLGDDEDEQQMAANRQAGPLDNLGGFRRTSGAFPANGWHAPAPFGQSPDLAQNWGGLAQSGMPGWNSNNASFAANNRGFGSIGSSTGMHRPSIFGSSNRPLTIRISVCQACKQLSSMSPGHINDFHEISTVVHQMEMNRPPLDAPPTLKEIEDICETEGDAQNGGGELQVRRSNTGSILAVRWQHDAATPEVGERQYGSLGEIGSPLPGKSNPSVIGFGAPGRERDKRASNAAATSTGVFNGRNMVSRF